MKYRTYPKTAVRVSEVGFGLWTTATGWWGEMTDEEAVALLHEAHDLGITLYDAADTYGNGRSEEQLASAFEARRDAVVYSTKFGYDFYTFAGERKGQNEIPQDFSPAFVRYALEQSLRRLKTDYIDISPRSKTTSSSRSWSRSATRARSAVSASRLGLRSAGSSKAAKQRAGATFRTCR